MPTAVALLAVAGMFACGRPQQTSTGSEDAVAAAGTATTATTTEVAPASPPAALAGRHWRLVELQSIDDSIGSPPDDTASCTMKLGADGMVSVRSTATAPRTWKAVPSEDGASGVLRVAPLAMTRAMCPPGSLDTRIAREAATSAAS